MLTVLYIPHIDQLPVEVRQIKGELEEYQAMVGGKIEFTDLRRARASIISNESGLIDGLEVNLRATELLYRHAPEHIDYTLLCGNCVVVGAANWYGESESCPQAIIDEMM